jgi:hypothetical protein
MRAFAGRSLHAWKLLGVHPAALTWATVIVPDEMLGLNNAWYADILMTLTEPILR